MNDTEELLLAGMDRFTRDVDAPSGLVAGAVRRRRRRRIAAAAAAGAGTIAMSVAVAVAVVMAGPGTGTQNTETVAYVISRTESALAAISSQNLVENARVTVTGPGEFAVGPGALLGIATGPSAELSPLLVEWGYRQQGKYAGYTANGQLISVNGWSQAGNRVTDTSVDYEHKTWSSRTTPAPPPLPNESSCVAARQVSLEIMGLVQGDFSSSLRTALRCGQYMLAGTQQVDGVRALELKQVPDSSYPGNLTFWVNPVSYLPLRSTATLGVYSVHNKQTDQNVRTDYRWLAPTPANTAAAAVTVPAGFTRVTAP
jgi:hypothetical protein